MNRNRNFRRHFLAGIESMEQKALLAVTPVHMISGTEITTPVKYSFIPVGAVELNITYSGTYSSLYTTDIYGNAVDFNKDGKTDVVITTGGVSEVLGYGTTNPTTAASRITHGQVGLGTANQFYILPRPGGLLGLPGFGFTSSAVTDLNGDGFQDIVNVELSESRISTYFWDPSINNFVDQPYQTLAMPKAAYDAPGPLTMGDINGDILPDLIIPRYVSSTMHPGFYVVGGYDIVLAKPEADGSWNGQFDPTPFLSLTVNPIENTYGAKATTAYQFPNVQSIARDLDNDGDIDLALPENNGISLWTNPGNGQFDPAAKVMVASASNVPGLNLVSGDFNNDGLIDIASSPNSSATNTYDPTTETWVAYVAPISIYLNQSSAATGLAMHTNAFDGTMTSMGQNGALSLGDFNLDGNLDLLIAPSEPINTSYAIALGDGSGIFLPVQRSNGFENADPIAATYYKRTIISVASGDFNGDGQIDVVSLGSPALTIVSSSNVENQYGMSLIGNSLNNTFQLPYLTADFLPNGIVGSAYSQQLTASGGNAALGYSFALDPTSFVLPAGLTLSPNGLISGTPTQSGTFQLFIKITQPNGLTGSSYINLVIDSANVNPVVITPGALPNAVAGLNYQVQLTSTGDPSTWSVTQGSLPAGLTLSSDGLLSGLPQAIGNYQFQVSAVGANGQTGQINYVMTVQAAAAPVITNVSRYGYHAQPTVFVVTYSQPMTEQSATNLSNYSLVMAGRDGIFGTRDDRKVPLRSAVYDTQTNGVTLIPMQRNVPLRQHYRLTVVGQPNNGVQNTSGVFLGGQGVGAPGTNYVTTFGSEILSGPSVELMAKARRRFLRPTRSRR
ncbi:MAG: hypothetical protein RJA81_2010 [Planctomycetota bacterium]|jgi:hypothetical protein